MAEVGLTAAERKQRSKGGRILVVEDDEGQALLTVRALRKRGYEVDREATGQGALSVLQKRGDLVVLLDLGLPDMNGMSVLEKIVAHSNEIPVIVVTGVDDLQIAVEAIQKGAWDYVVKRVDLTHVDELPHVIERNQDRQRLVHERNLFVSMLSHDIKNPVQVILSYADIIQEEADLSAEAQQFLERIKHNAEHILQLVRDFVDVRKIEAGKLLLNRNPMSIQELLGDVVSQQSALAGAKAIHLDLTVEGSPAEILADRQCVQRALTNLVGNAIKYTPDAGSVHVNAHDEDDHLVISVTDTGQGIAADEVPHVFEKYRRARSHGAVEGTGLGLYIVKAIIDAHGGDVEVQSTIEAGSTFTIRLPRAGTAEDEARPNA